MGEVTDRPVLLIGTISRDIVTRLASKLRVDESDDGSGEGDRDYYAEALRDHAASRCASCRVSHAMTLPAAIAASCK